MIIQESIRTAKLISVITIVIFSLPARAQNIRTGQRRNSFWNEVNLSGAINKHFALQFDYRYRRQSDHLENSMFHHPHQVAFRPWLHYFPKQNRLLRISMSPIGYWSTYIPVFQEEDSKIIDQTRRESYVQFHEFRTSYQISFTDKTEHRVTGSYQLRYELRWIGNKENGNATQDRSGFDFSHDNSTFSGKIKQRIRIFYKAELALIGKTIDAKEPYLGFTEEIDIGLSKDIAITPIDQNRLALVLGYKYSDKLRLELGYLNQINELSTSSSLGISQKSLMVNHVLQLNLHFDNFQKYFHRKNK
jgi:hypothetical protein